MRLDELKTDEKLICNKLKYDRGALAPVMSKHNVEVHYDILTKNYFKKYNETGDLFQKAGAVLHNQYWSILKPYSEKNEPTRAVTDILDDKFGSFKKFKDAWIEKALTLRGSGWIMLSKKGSIFTVENHAIKPNAILIDLWEHASVDYDFNKEKFLTDFWKIIDWDVVEKRFS